MLKYLNKLLTMIKKSVNIRILLLVIVLIMISICLNTKFQKTEKFVEEEQEAKKYDDALEQRIGEVKEEAPRFDAELILDTNKPFREPREDNMGWWAQVISGDIIPNIYTRPMKSWIFPY